VKRRLPWLVTKPRARYTYVRKSYVGGELCVLTILFELLTRFSIVFTISMNVVMAVFTGIMLWRLYWSGQNQYHRSNDCESYAKILLLLEIE